MKLRALVLFAALCSVASGPVAAMHFAFDCINERYISKPVGQSHEFRAPIQGIPPGDRPVLVTFKPHIPDSWLAQWTQFSTGQTHFGTDQIVLIGGYSDRLDIEFFPDPSTPGKGWVDVTIASVEDPYERTRCTFTLFSGLPVPAVDFEIDCQDNVRWVEEAQYFEFHSPLRNHLPEADSLMVLIIPDLVEGWDMHFCHGGICYNPYGEFPVASESPDSIVIMCYVSEIPGSSGIDMILQSKRNPSLAQYCSYRAYLQQPQGVEPAEVAKAPDLRVRPNPSSQATSFTWARAGSGSAALSLFRADGRLVREFPAIDLARGGAAIRWDGRDQSGAAVSPGIYFYRWSAGEETIRGTLVRTR
jgi:hypothetical protein